jgi:hypothetical protein
MKLTLPWGNRGLRAAAVVLALAALAGVVTGREKPGLELAEARPAPQQAAAGAPAAAADIDLAKLQRPASPAAQGDPFAPRSFAPPRQPVRTARGEKPGAPPLPFTYVGRVTQDGVTEVLVTRGDELISVAAGRSIDGEYRVDAVSESRIAFTYLPLKAKQSLELEGTGG